MRWVSVLNFVWIKFSHLAAVSWEMFWFSQDWNQNWFKFDIFVPWHTNWCALYFQVWNIFTVWLSVERIEGKKIESIFFSSSNIQGDAWFIRMNGCSYVHLELCYIRTCVQQDWNVVWCFCFPWHCRFLTSLYSIYFLFRR